MISESVVEKVGEGVRSARRSLTQPWKMGELRGRWGRGCRSDVVGDEAEKQQVAAACWCSFDADSLHNKYRVPKETMITPKKKKKSKEYV